MSVQANKHPPISIESIAADHLVQVTQGLPCLPFASLTPKIVPLEKDHSISWTRLSVPITSKKPRGNRFKKLPAWRENAAFSELLSYQRAASPTKLWLFLIIVSFGVHPRCGSSCSCRTRKTEFKGSRCTGLGALRSGIGFRAEGRRSGAAIW